MKRLITIVLLLLLIATFLIPGCTGRAYSYDNFVDDLRDSVVSVLIMGEVKVSPFLVKGKNIRVNGENVNVYEFGNKAQADEEAALINPDGCGLSRIDETGTGTAYAWSPIGPSHFYKKGRLIVYYVDVSHGSDPTVRNLFESILGSQFAGQ